MPKTQKDTRREGRLPTRLCGDNLVHEFEQSVRIILDFDIDVELDMLVFGLNKSTCSFQSLA